MAYLTLCNGCADGDHSKHYSVVQVVPEGMIGGAVCPCDGECDGNPVVKETVGYLIALNNLLRSATTPDYTSPEEPDCT